MCIVGNIVWRLCSSCTSDICCQLFWGEFYKWNCLCCCKRVLQLIYHQWDSDVNVFVTAMNVFGIGGDSEILMDEISELPTYMQLNLSTLLL